MGEAGSPMRPGALYYRTARSTPRPVQHGGGVKLPGVQSSPTFATASMTSSASSVSTLSEPAVAGYSAKKSSISFRTRRVEAARLCEADMASINREHGDAYQQIANYGHSPELQAYMDSHPIPAGAVRSLAG